MLEDALDLWSLLDVREVRGLLRRRTELPSGVSLHMVERAGMGTPVVFLHGIWGWWGYWRTLLNAQPDPFAGRPLWMVDLRGHGDSDKPEAGYTLDDYARDIVALFQTREAQCVSLGGHSVGALTALLVVALIPDMVESIVLEDPPLPQRPGGADVFRGVFELKHLALNTIAEELRFGRPTMSEPQARESAMCLKATADGVFTAKFTGPMLNVDVPKPGVTLSVPALVIQAGNSEDRALRSGGEALLRAVLPRVEVVTIEGTSHTVLRNDPDRYACAIGAFFNGR